MSVSLFVGERSRPQITTRPLSVGGAVLVDARVVVDGDLISTAGEPIGTARETEAIAALLRRNDSPQS